MVSFAGGRFATAYFLAKERGVRDIAALEHGTLGTGNVGRNSAKVRSNCLRDESISFLVKLASFYENLLKHGLIDVVDLL